MTLTQSPPIVEAVRRRLEMDELPGPRSTVRAAFTLTTTLGQAPAQLWPMLSRLDRLAQWYGPVSGELREGGRLQLPGGWNAGSSRSRRRTRWCSSSRRRRAPTLNR